MNENCTWYDYRIRISTRRYHGIIDPAGDSGNGNLADFN
jgi:hypothetical protein